MCLTISLNVTKCDAKEYPGTRLFPQCAVCLQSYCSVSCQQQDWKTGYHKINCQPPVGVLNEPPSRSGPMAMVHIDLRMISGNRFLRPRDRAFLMLIYHESLERRAEALIAQLTGRPNVKDTQCIVKVDCNQVPFDIQVELANDFRQLDSKDASNTWELDFDTRLESNSYVDWSRVVMFSAPGMKKAEWAFIRRRP